VLVVSSSFVGITIARSMSYNEQNTSCIEHPAGSLSDPMLSNLGLAFFLPFDEKGVEA
jgi:hypothetical protein